METDSKPAGTGTVGAVVVRGHCVDCWRWHGTHINEYANCTLVGKTARMFSCRHWSSLEEWNRKHNQENITSDCKAIQGDDGITFMPQESGEDI